MSREISTTSQSRLENEILRSLLAYPEWQIKSPAEIGQIAYQPFSSFFGAQKALFSWIRHEPTRNVTGLKSNSTDPQVLERVSSKMLTQQNGK